MKSIQSKRKGYAIVELLFYIIIFLVLTLAIINSFITMTKSFRETTISADLVQSASIMERISREIRQSYGISSISSNSIKLNTTDDSGANKTVQFDLSGTNARILDNDVFTGNLNTPNIQVTSLSFTQITTAVGTAVKISFSVQSARDASGRSETYYDTVVLRGDY